MILDVKIPSPGESITEVELSNWLVADGDYVEKDQELAEVESDKATLPIIAEQAGEIKILVEAGSTVKVGETACTVDTSVEGEKAPNAEEKVDSKAEVEEEKEAEAEKTSSPAEGNENVKVSPLAKKVMKENNLDVDAVIKGLRRINKADVEAVLSSTQLPGLSESQEVTREEQREKMTSLRRKLSQRLVEVKNETAMLTTFNEVDMSYVMDMRKKHQKAFIDKHGIKLGFMSFFTKAASVALQLFPKVNSMIDGEEIITPKYTDISIAVQTEKGLMVPVVRNVETLGLADIEHEIKQLAEKARKFRLPIEDMTGGTFTITNGGVFGSMLSTPIINPPQSGILGMHNIVERPMAVNGKVEVRPVMYIALSYDHRIIDGRDSVGFLYKVKELIENPTMLLTAGNDPEKVLLGV